MTNIILSPELYMTREHGMNKILLPEYPVKILGMMSGTSGDGIDGVLAEFDQAGNARFVWHDSYSFSLPRFSRIQSLMKGTDSQTVTLGSSYGAELYALACHEFMSRHVEKPDFIAAHGQTVFHQPQPVDWDGIKITGTLQLLNGSLLALRCNMPVICGFRAADMAAGGQGAPLVPFADLFLFGSTISEDMVVVNIGGMANITVISSWQGKSEVVAAFDTGPGNVLMDLYMQSHQLGRFDIDGKLAACGKTNAAALECLLEDPYFSLKPPKSTGREYFNASCITRIENLMQSASHADIISTLLDVTVASVADAILASAETFAAGYKVLVAGGGALNPELMRRLAKKLAGKAILNSTAEFGMPVMAREAMAFAILGYSFLAGRAANVKIATGARNNVILGEYHPQPDVSGQTQFWVCGIQCCCFRTG
jgi:anhydro-N-acetylmuramic acid kinase